MKDTVADKISIGNGDRDKILANVRKKVLEYVDEHPEIKLLATVSVSEKKALDEVEMRVRTLSLQNS